MKVKNCNSCNIMPSFLNLDTTDILDKKIHHSGWLSCALQGAQQHLRPLDASSMYTHANTHKVKLSPDVATCAGGGVVKNALS